MTASILKIFEAYSRGEVVDRDGHTALDELITEANGDPKTWLGRVEAFLREPRPCPTSYWIALEFLLAYSSLRSPLLPNLLEDRLAGDRLEARARASIYSMLAMLGKPVAADTIFKDTQLQAEEPLRWLDLALPSIADPDLKTDLVRAAIRQGHLNPKQFLARLEEFRIVAGRQFGNWLHTMVQCFTMADRTELTSALAPFGLRQPHSYNLSEAKPIKRGIRQLREKRQELSLA
ncbi:hypothetical protein [Hyphomicrobium sp. D-2]|uniref:hypothetical protein n=1 Tax=Hyphomicrobium sp. D-2 TaxID=3041621 RepID=UPI002457F7EA|nr:hypothetical protein [Hyphomicrobium sp. D-2]MDH4981877.1 hypothetical protein [Hyphomicrobium sp. D-2]